ncbi:hypothetical protein T11_10897 [Trichinella zimbabwensis]|uniref:Uncharacterized protein n=1 Tax=Trichinella zimbabwensis TaxID=268475 RepID=A0A0V1HZT8_9BILA|nr:hypothetical protein T11_10897 [Trichinella zimbabwensis]
MRIPLISPILAYWNPFLDFRLARYLLYGREEGMIDLPGRLIVIEPFS